MPNVNKVKLLSERTSGAPPVVFHFKIKPAGLLVLSDTLEDEGRDTLVKRSQPNRPKVTKEPIQMLAPYIQPSVYLSFSNPLREAII